VVIKLPKSPHDFYIFIPQTKETIRMSDIGIYVEFFDIDAPETEIMSQTTEMIDGSKFMGARYRERKMKAGLNFLTDQFGLWDFYRNRLFRAIKSKQPFFIVRDLEQGKRWTVICENGFSVERDAVRGFASIDFISFSPYAESLVETSANFVFNNNKTLQFDMGLVNSERLKYKHTTNRFTIYNAGDVTIDPRQHYFIVRMHVNSNASWSIVNHTTKDNLTIKKQVTPSDLVAINGHYVGVNNIRITRDTNFGVITLLPGDNDIEISGAGVTDIEFYFRFLYL